MSWVTASAEEDYVDTDYGNVFGLRVRCDACGREVCVGGTGDGSFRLAAKLLRDECPRNESNFYEVQ